jgi:hypothetical protein
MSQESRITLKALFENGDLMTQDSFEKIIDSNFNFVDDDDVIIVNLYGDLPVSPDLTLACVKDAIDDPTIVKNIPALYLFDNSTWNLVSRIDSIVYTTDLPDATTSPGFDVTNELVGKTVLDLKGITFSDFIDTYAFPTIDASISQGKSASLSRSGSGLVEIGTLLDITLEATFVRGQIQNGDGSAGPTLVGNPNTFQFSGPGIAVPINIVSTNLVETIDSSNPGYTPAPAISGTQNWSTIISHDGGIGGYFDSKGNPQTLLDGSRVAGNSNANSQTVTGRYRAFHDIGYFPVDSAGVRGAASPIIYLSGSNTGSFNITIPAFTLEVWFAVPAGKTIAVAYVESFGAPVEGEFTADSFNVNDANGTPVAYDTWKSTIPGIGYTAIATYAVTIS